VAQRRERALGHAGEHLHLHRNAVAYRIKNIQTLLDADLEDADDRFALELACRAWSGSAILGHALAEQPRNQEALNGIGAGQSDRGG
jgi:hypothetical protein